MVPSGRSGFEISRLIAHRTSSLAIGFSEPLCAPLVGTPAPFRGSLSEPGTENIRINRRKYDWHGTGIEQPHAERRVGGSPCDRKFFVPVGGRDDAHTRVDHVGMTQIADVP